MTQLALAIVMKANQYINMKSYQWQLISNENNG